MSCRAAHSFFSSVITPMINRYAPKGLRSNAVSMAVAAHAPAAAMDTALLRKPFGVYLLVMGVMTLLKKE